MIAPRTHELGVFGGRQSSFRKIKTARELISQAIGELQSDEKIFVRQIWIASENLIVGRTGVLLGL